VAKLEDTGSLINLRIDQLSQPAYWEQLFSVGNDFNLISFPDDIIAARSLDDAGSSFELVTGIERFRLLRESGAEILPVLAVKMSAEDARVYATDEMLRRSAVAAQRSVVQLLVAARDNESRGGDWSVERITEQIKIKRSTYTHAWSSVNYVCLELQKAYPEETAGMGTTELVATAVKSDFMPSFTSLYWGRTSVDRFYRDVYLVSDLARERSRQQEEAKEKKGALRKPKSVEEGKPAAPQVSPSFERLLGDGLTALATASAAQRSESAGWQTDAEIKLAIGKFFNDCPELADELTRVSRIILKHLRTRPLVKNAAVRTPNSGHSLPF
jgi:hypothetical protein